MKLDSGAIGVGIDMTDVGRIRKLIEKYGETFLQKTFDDTEIKYCAAKADPALHYAARFAAKEAMAKALGTGFAAAITFKSVCVANDENGAPRAVLDTAAQNRMRELGASQMLISITHLKEYAQAIAIISK